MAPRVTRSSARSVASSVEPDGPESVVPRRTPARGRGQSRAASTADPSSPTADQSVQTGRLPHVATSLNTAFGAVGTPAMEDSRLQDPALALTSVLDNVRALELDDDMQSPSERAASKSQKSASLKSGSQRSASVRSQPVARHSQRQTPGGLARVDEEEITATNTRGPGSALGSQTYIPTSVSYTAPALAPTSVGPVFNPGTWYRRLRGVSSVAEGADEARAQHNPGESEFVSRHAREDSEPHSQHSSRHSEVPSQHNADGSESAPSELQSSRETDSITPSIRGMAEGLANFCLDNAHHIRGLLGIAFLLAMWGLLVTFLPNLEIGTMFRNLVDTVADQADRARNASMNNTIFDPSLYTRINKVENDLSSLQIQLTQLQHRLPEHIVLTKDPESGELVIPEEFYSAFLHQLQHEESFQSGLTDSWNGFLRDNQARVESLIHTETQTRFDNLTDSGVIVTHRTFTEALKEHSLAMSKSIIKQQDLHTEVMDSRIKRLASEVATNIATDITSRRMSDSGSKYIEDILLLNLAKQLDLQRQRNYLSASAGAEVDNRITSPTFRTPQPDVFSLIWSRIDWTGSLLPHKPRMALLPWTENGECWCAARSNLPGTAQLGVTLPRPVRPRALVLEHVHAAGTWEVRAAPKHVEVWGRRPKGQYLAPKAPEPSCSGPEPDAPGVWICLGTGRYDVHGPNEVQKITLHPPRWPVRMLHDTPRDPDAVSVDEIAVRVMENWGGDFTCIYRVRLLGEGAEEILHEKRVN